MASKQFFAIFPYLKTSKPVSVRDVTLRSSNDLEGLSEEMKNHLLNLFSMFFLRNELRITEMSYTILQIGDDEEQNEALMQRLREAQILIAYRYSRPHPIDGRPFLILEYSSLYLFDAKQVSDSLVWPRDRVENLAGQTPFATERRGPWLDGYYGLLNWTSPLWVVPGIRIYPPIPNLLLNLPQQDLADDLYAYEFNWQTQAMLKLVSGRRLTIPEAESRIFTAIEWHNRSNSDLISQDVSLMNLAIALESLLNLERGDESKKFKETVKSLLGSVPRLDSWLEQFYKARSKIVHKGTWPHLMFYAVDAKHVSKVLEASEDEVPYRSLTAYGHHILRLCLNTVLVGAMMAEDAGLSSMLIHNQERLETICRKLNERNTSPAERLLSISREVRDLQQYWIESSRIVRLETVFAVGR
jgi:hypothetical protein